MATGFASKVLEIAQKRESERITIVQEKVLEVFSKICQQRIKSCSPFTQGEYVSIPINDLIEAPIQKSDFIRICNASEILVGENLTGTKMEFVISDLSNYSEKQPIKQLLHSTNLEIYRRIDEESHKAEELCAKIFQKLLNGDFEQEYHPGYEGLTKDVAPFYSFLVKFPTKDISTTCFSKASKIMEQEGFSLVKNDANSFELTINATDYSNFF